MSELADEGAGAVTVTDGASIGGKGAKACLLGTFLLALATYPPRGDEQTSIAGAPARTEVGAQIYNQAINTVMVSKFTQGGEKLDDVIKWAETELEATLRA